MRRRKIETIVEISTNKQQNSLDGYMYEFLYLRFAKAVWHTVSETRTEPGYTENDLASLQEIVCADGDGEHYLAKLHRTTAVIKWQASNPNLGWYGACVHSVDLDMEAIKMLADICKTLYAHQRSPRDLLLYTKARVVKTYSTNFGTFHLPVKPENAIPAPTL